jgi:hypothetical protein
MAHTAQNQEYEANLALGRGKRPKLNHETVSMRMSGETKHELERLAQSYGCTYGGKPWIAGLLTRIANRELLVVPPTYMRPLVEQREPQPPDLNEKVEKLLGEAFLAPDPCAGEAGDTDFPKDFCPNASPLQLL